MSYSNCLMMTKMLAEITDSRLTPDECPLKKEKSRLFNWILLLIALKTQECIPAQKSFIITIETDTISSHIVTLTNGKHYYYSEHIFGSSFLNVMENVSNMFNEINNSLNGYKFVSVYNGTSHADTGYASMTIKLVKT